MKGFCWESPFSAVNRNAYEKEFRVHIISILYESTDSENSNIDSTEEKRGIF